MQMIAKYPGRCKACGGKIVRGQPIDWRKGEGARHLNCASAPTAEPPADAGRVPLDEHGEPVPYAYDPVARAYICPNCRRPVLSRSYVRRRYQCDACADAEEGPMASSF